MYDLHQKCPSDSRSDLLLLMMGLRVLVVVGEAAPAASEAAPGRERLFLLTTSLEAIA